MSRQVLCRSFLFHRQTSLSATFKPLASDFLKPITLPFDPSTFTKPKTSPRSNDHVAQDASPAYHRHCGNPLVRHSRSITLNAHRLTQLNLGIASQPTFANVTLLPLPSSRWSASKRTLSADQQRVRSPSPPRSPYRPSIRIARALRP